MKAYPIRDILSANFSNFSLKIDFNFHPKCSNLLSFISFKEIKFVKEQNIWKSLKQPVKLTKKGGR